MRSLILSIVGAFVICPNGATSSPHLCVVANGNDQFFALRTMEMPLGFLHSYEKWVRVHQITTSNRDEPRNFRLWEDNIGEIGWVHERSLECGQNPEISQDFSKVRFLAGTPQPVGPYADFDSDNCSHDCAVTVPGSVYFVHSALNNRDQLLVSSDEILVAEQSQMGWIDKDEGIIWSTGEVVQVRPETIRPGLGGRSADYVASDICGFRQRQTSLSIDRSQRIDDCYPFMRHHEKPGIQFLMPIIDDYADQGADQGMVRVVGLVNEGRGSISRQNFPRRNNLSQVLLDIRIVQDGTARNGPAIDALKGVNGDGRDVLAWIETVLTSGFDENQADFRVSFFIYGDGSDEPSNPYGRDGLSGTFYKSNYRCGEGNLGERNDWLRFREALEEAKVEHVVPSFDLPEDYAENLRGAVLKAISDSNECNADGRVIFVIGEAGYDEGRRRARGRGIISSETVVHAINEMEQSSRIVFIRMPRVLVSEEESRQKYYDLAYDDFEAEARNFAAESALEAGSVFFEQLPNEKLVESLRQIVINHVFGTRSWLLSDGSGRYQEQAEFLSRDIGAHFIGLPVGSDVEEINNILDDLVEDGYRMLPLVVEWSESFQRRLVMTENDWYQWLNLLTLLSVPSVWERKAAVLRATLKAYGVGDTILSPSSENFGIFLARFSGLPNAFRSAALAFDIEFESQERRLQFLDVDERKISDTAQHLLIKIQRYLSARDEIENGYWPVTAPHSLFESIGQN